jgi:O-antigen/teichoic acid export membrane protein
MKKTSRELFISNTVFNVSFKLVNQLIALFILPLFVKNLGTELYGIWVISGITLGYLGMVDMGFTQGVMKYIAEAYAKKDFLKFNKVINTASILFFLMGSVILLVVFLFHAQIVRLFSIRPENIETACHLLVITGVFAPLLWTTRITDTTFQGILRFKEYSIVSGIQALGKTLTMLYLVYDGYGIISIAIITNIVHLVLWTPSLVVLVRILPDLSFGKRFLALDVIKEIMPFSMGVFYSQLIAMLALEADNLIIGIAVSMSGVTAYVVASKLFYTSYSYMGMLSGVLQPTTYQAFANDDKVLIDKILAKGTKYMTMLYTPIGYLGIIISPLFIETWMGIDYLQYAIWSQAFIAVFIVTIGFGMPVNLVFNSGRTRPPNVFKTVSIIVNLTISILLVKKFGIGGPILGTLIAGLLGPLTFPYFCKLIEADWKKHTILVLKIISINLPSSIFFYWISLNIDAGWLNLIGLSLIIMIVHFLTLYLAFFTSDEKKDIRIFLETLGFFKLIKIAG